jgi:hypothetical protein
MNRIVRNNGVRLTLTWIVGVGFVAGVYPTCAAGPSGDDGPCGHGFLPALSPLEPCHLFPLVAEPLEELYLLSDDGTRVADQCAARPHTARGPPERA